MRPEDPFEVVITSNTPPAPSIGTKEKADIAPDSIEGNVREETDERGQYAALFSTLLESNALLLDEIRALRQQQSALSTHRNEVFTEENRSTQSLSPELLEAEAISSSHSPTHTLRSVSTQQDNGESPWGEEVVDIESTTFEQPASECSESIADSSVDFLRADPFASPGALAVQSMWDNFSVDDYWSPDSTETKDSPKKGTETWSPKITVPEPFSMTIREAQTPKQKSRSLKIAEEEMLRKAAMEEVELNKKFRASPIPASTFLPLYELVNAKNEQRKEEIVRLSKDFLRATQRPFSFTQREKEIKQIKAKQAALMKQIEEKERKKNVFKAQPVPKNLFSPDIGEHICEQEDYRQLRIQMRSKELLASSKLPGSMESRYKAKHGRRSLSLEQRKEQDCLFHPNINGIVPDYDRAYCEFQKKLAAKRRTKQTTITEPFFLHTQQKASCKQQAVAAPHIKVSLRSPEHSHSQPILSIYPAQMTQTALLRQSVTQDKLTRKVQEHDTERMQRSREMKKSIAKKSLASGTLREKPTQKLREFQ